MQAAGIDRRGETDTNGGQQLGVAIDAEHFAVGRGAVEQRRRVPATVDGRVDAARPGLQIEEVEQFAGQDR